MAADIADAYHDEWAALGPPYEHAREILMEGCEVPPSLETFQEGLAFTRRRARYPLSVQQYARIVVEKYKRLEEPG